MPLSDSLQEGGNSRYDRLIPGNRDDKFTILVGSTPGVVIHNSGGQGTGLFMSSDLLLISGAGLLLWLKRRTT